LGNAADRLDSAEDFLDPFAAALTDGVAGMAPGAAIAGTVS
jgi:hypothetical protein